MFVAASIPSFLHATIAGYVAHTLLLGATTEPRRRLGRSFALFAAYSITIGLGYSVSEPWSSRLFGLCVLLATASSLDFVEFARWMVFGGVGARAGWWGRHALLVLGLFALIGMVRQAPNPGHEPFYAVLAGLSLLAILGALAVVTAGVARGIAIARPLLLAVLCPLAPAALDILNAFGFRAPFYAYVRDVSLLLYCFLSLTAYMDHGSEPISLRRRFLGGLLTAVLAVVACSSEWAAIIVQRGVGNDHATQVHRAAVGFGVVGALASAIALIAFPRMIRRSLLSPLERFGIAARTIQSGGSARVDITSLDELGGTARAFNQMVDTLAAHRNDLEQKVADLELRNAEVASLNAELRRQIAARSRQLQDVLTGQESSPTMAEGELVAQRYRVLRHLGGGGMGVVYAVEDEVEHRRLALKVVANATSRDELVRFAREAEISVTVAHPNIVRVLDVGVHQGCPFLVMELITGGSLDQARARYGDLVWASGIVHDIAAALEALHARGIVHRDLKPANVLLEDRGSQTVARLTDFGIASSNVDVFAATMASGDRPRPLTATGMMIGTLPYMAPEGARGVRELTGKADIFALGLICYELFSGQYPFLHPPILEQLAGRPLAALPRLPPELSPDARAFVTACLAQEPEARPTARAMAATFARDVAA